MNKDLVAIFEYLEREKGIKRELVKDAIEESLLSAARKSVKGYINVSVQVDSKTGDIQVVAQKEIVDNVTIPEEEMLLEEALELNPDAQVGDWIDIIVTPEDFGRIAAQTARQVIAQKLRVAERDVIYDEYRHRIGDVVSGSVKRNLRGRTLIVDLGKVEAIMPDRFYPRTETYNVGERVQALLLEVRETPNGGAEVVLSRSHPDFVRYLFEQEVPEIGDGSVVIEKIVRDAGYRTKLAVRSTVMKVDPVGACVGVRGTRVKNIIRELNNEKIDIIPYTEDRLQLLENALNPIEIRKIRIDEEENAISIVVEDEDYPAVIGKKGMNARLLSALIEATLDIQKLSEHQKLLNIQRQQLALEEDPSLDEPLEIEGMSPLILESLRGHGYDTPRKVLKASLEELQEIPEISLSLAEIILEEIRKARM